MNTCVIIYGNMASGKSTLSHCIMERLSGFTYVCLDDFRISVRQQYPDYSPLACEQEAERQCARVLEQDTPIIWEATGASRFFIRNYNRMRGHRKILMVRIACSPEACFVRFHMRPHTGVRLPFNTTDLRRSLYHMDDAIGTLSQDITLDTERFSSDTCVEQFFTFYLSRRYGIE